MKNIPASIAFYGMLLMVIPIAIPYGTVDPWLIHLTAAAIGFFGCLRMLDGILKREFRFAEPALLCPLLLITVFTFIQFLPLELPALRSITKPLSLDPLETRGAAARFAALLIFAEVLFHYAGSRRRLKMMLAAVLVVGIGSALFAWTRIIFGIEPPRLPPAVGFGQFINRNHFAFLAEMTLGVLGGWLVRRKLAPHWRLTAGAASFLIFVTLIVSKSRGAIFAIAAMGFFAVLLFTAHQPNAAAETRTAPDSGEIKGDKPFWRKIKFAPLLIVFFGAVFVFAVAFVGGDPVVSRLEKLPSEVEESTGAGYRRMDIWKATVDLIAENPIAGSGFGAYGAAITKHDRSPGNLILQQAHNDFLELAASGGLPGLILATVFLTVFARRARRQVNSPDDFRRAVAFGAATGVVGVLFHSAADFGLHTSINAFIFIILIVLATVEVERTALSGSPPEKPFGAGARRFFFALCFAVMLLTVIKNVRIGVSFFLSDKAARTSRIECASQAIEWDGKNAYAFETRGQIYFWQRNYEKAAADLETAIALRPNEYLLRLQAAAVFRQLGDLEKAREFTGEAERLAPHYAAPPWLTGKLYLEEKRYDEAFAHLNRAANRQHRLFPELFTEANFVYFKDPAIDRAVVPETHAAKMLRAIFYVEQNIESPANESFMTGDETSDGEKAQFIERLLRRKNYDLAYRVWKSGTRSALQTGNLIDNGDFETDLSVEEKGFGWRVGAAANVELARRDGQFFSSARSLQVNFAGNSNPEQPILSQLIPVQPQTAYRLRFAVRMDDDFRSGGLPLVMVADAETNRTLALSEPIKSTGGSWKVVSLSFQTAVDARVVFLSIRRHNCPASPCPAFGSVFFDDFRLANE